MIIMMTSRPEKFAPLTKFLRQKAGRFRDSGETSLRMGFKEIEELGLTLPPSAYRHRAWWSNNRFIGANAKDRSFKPWDRANFKTANVDMKWFKLEFEYLGPWSEKGLAAQEASAKEGGARLEEWCSRRNLGSEANQMSPAVRSSGISDTARPYSAAENAPSVPKATRRHPIFGALKGTIRIVAGTDLTEPADPEWGNIAWGDGEK